MTGLTKGTSQRASVAAAGMVVVLLMLAADGDASGARSASERVGVTSYPRSYYSGPLGRRNILPTKRGAFLIVHYGGYGTSRPQGRAGVLQREHDLGRLFDGVQAHFGGEGTYRGATNCIAPDRVAERPLDWIHRHGSFPVAIWSPNRMMAKIANAGTDRCIGYVADYLGARHFPIMLRLFSEFDVSTVRYHACGPEFITAWRRIVSIFKQHGATNVGFWWNPEEGVDRDCVNASYPGDQYVDWIGSDWYNTCDVGDTNCWSTPLHSGWAEFAELFNYGPSSQYALWSSRKPFVIGETSSVYDDNSPAKRGQWFRNIAAAARSMPRLAGVSFYDSDVSAVEGPRGNYRVDYKPSNPDVYAGFKTMAADSWFNTR